MREIIILFVKKRTHTPTFTLLYILCHAYAGSRTITLFTPNFRQFPIHLEGKSAPTSHLKPYLCNETRNKTFNF